MVSEQLALMNSLLFYILAIQRVMQAYSIWILEFVGNADFQVCPRHAEGKSAC